MFGLPNITGSLSEVMQYAPAYLQNGAFTSTDKKYNNFSTGSGGSCYTVTLNASASSSVYGASATVQPSSILLLPCIKF